MRIQVLRQHKTAKALTDYNALQGGDAKNWAGGQHGLSPGQCLKGTDLEWGVYRLPSSLDNMGHAAECDLVNLAWL